MSRFLKMAVALSLIIAVAMLVGACGPAKPTTDEPTVKRLVVAQGTDIRGWDIHDHNTTSTEAVHINVLDYLVYRDAAGDIGPGLATSWDQVDELTWRLYLRDDVFFHNGDKFTSADVKWTLERVAFDSSLVENGAYRQIAAVEIVDEYTVDILTHAPQPVLLYRLCRLGSGMLPSSYIEEVGWDEFAENPVGTGPFKVRQWIRDDRLILEAFEDHWRGRPYLDELVFRAIPEDSTRVAEALTGGVDIAVNIPPEDWDRIRNTAGVDLTVAMSNRVMMLEVRHHPEFLTSDPRIREAVELAIDSQLIVDALIAGEATVTRTRVTPGNFGANPNLYNTQLYDPERARELLAEAGYPSGGAPITIAGCIGRYLKDVETVEMIVGMLEAVGFDVSYDFYAWRVYSTMLTSYTHPDLHLIGYGNSLFDAALAFGVYTTATGDQRYGFIDPDLQDKILKAEVEMDREARRAMYLDIAEIVAEGRPQIYLFQTPNAYAIRDGVKFSPQLDEMLPMFGVRID